MYLTYDEYISLGGTLDSATFDNLEFDAESIINWYTFNRLVKETEISPTVKRLVMRLISLLNDKQKAQVLGQSASGDSVATPTIVSQSNDGFSTTYNVLSASDMIAQTDKEVEQLIRRSLQTEVNSLGKKLLYRGVYADE